MILVHIMQEFPVIIYAEKEIVVFTIFFLVIYLKIRLLHTCIIMGHSIGISISIVMNMSTS